MKLLVLLCLFVALLAAKPNNETIKVFIVPHSHCDVGWLYTVDEYFDLAVKNILDSTVAALIKDQRRKFIWVETAFFHKWWRQATDSQQQQFRYLLTKTRQIEFIIGGWVMNDEAVTTYSADIDQMTHGHQFLLQEFGEFGRARVGWQIDPFGASAVQPTLYKLMDFDYTVTARIDYNLKNELKRTKGLEFVWEGSPNLKNASRIFGHVLDDSYCTPWGFDFEGAFPWGYDGKANPAINDTNIKNRSEEFIKILKARASYYATNNLLFPYGCDFEYREAERNFGNMTLLIDYINAHKDVYGMELKYSLLTEYFDTVVRERPLDQWPVYKSDFTPYADNEHSYWTGYYTSVPRIKEVARRGERLARTAETLFVPARIERNIDRWNSFDALYALRSANGDVQHHDGITGTERPHVVNMYVNNIDTAAIKTNNVSANAIALLMQQNGAKLLSLSKSTQIMQTMVPGMRYPVVVYNSLGWEREEFVSIPVPRSDITIHDDLGVTLPYQIEGEEGNLKLVFMATGMPPLGYKTYFITLGTNPPSASKKWVDNNDMYVNGTIYDLVFCASSGHLCKVVNKASGVQVNVNHNFMAYDSFFNSTQGQTSGAYIFRPLTQSAYSVSFGRPSTTVTYGAEYTLITQAFSNYAQQTIRLYKKDPSAIHVTYDVGVLPGNKEFISRFETNIKNNRILYHDSNALEKAKRSFNNDTKEPTSSNYYATQYSSFIRDENAQLVIVTDRSHGVASLINGSLEVMLHRRCMQDDFRGLGEEYPLNDTTIIHANMRLIIDDNTNAPILRHRHSYLNNYPLDVFVVQQGVSDWKNFTQTYRTVYTPLSAPLPPNIHLLSLQAYDKDSTTDVLRFINIYELDEVAGAKSYSEQVNVNKLFKDWVLYDWTEMNLSASGMKKKGTGELNVTVKPIEMKTYFVEFGQK